MTAALQQGLSSGLGIAAPPARAVEALVSLMDAAAQAWPSAKVDPAAFAKFVGEKLNQAGRGLAELPRMHVGDLYLAFACSTHDAGALKHFEQRFMARMPDYVRMRNVDLDEVASVLREKLLVGEKPRILDYLGTGPLDGWVRIAAVRTAISLRRAAKQWLTMSDDATSRAVSAAPTPEARVATAQVGQRLRDAVRTALDGLDEKQRNMITLYYLEEATLEKLALVYAVHLSTVARWLERARLQLCKATLSALGAADAAAIGDEDIEAALDGFIASVLRSDN